MKFSNLILIGVLLSFIAFTKCNRDNNNQVIVEIKTEPGSYDSVGCYLSRNSIAAYSLWGFSHSNFDTAGYTKLILENDGINWLFLCFHKEDEKTDWDSRSRVFLIVRPGEHYKICHFPDSTVFFKINGNFDEGQTFFNDFEHLQPRPFNLDVKDPGILYSDLIDTIEQTLTPLRKLLDEKRIDRTFYKIAKAKVEYQFVLGFSEGLKRRYSYYTRSDFEPPRNIVPINILEEKYYKLIEAIFKQFPYNSKYAPLVSNYGDYLNNYVWFNTLKDTSFNYSTEKLENVEFAGEIFNDELCEFYFAHQFQRFSLRGGIGEELERYDVFLEQYPNSAYKPGIERHLIFAGKFYSEMYPLAHSDTKDNETKIKFGKYIMSEDITIIDEDDDILSLDSLLRMFRGKKIFIDNWASWCLPCRGEFIHADTLYTFLKNHGYEMLYISSDKDKDKWLSTIQQYQLKGFHFRITTPEIRKELVKLAPTIPRYFIVDTSGQIFEYDAKRPSSGEELYQQLLKYMK